MKKVNLQIQNDVKESKQHGRHLSLRIDEVPVMSLNILRVYLKKQIMGMLLDILIEPIVLVKPVLIKLFPKKTLGYCCQIYNTLALYNSLPVKKEYEK